MAVFNRFIRGLQALFPSSGQALPRIDELSSTVTPVYPFPPRSAVLENVRIATLVSTVNVNPTLFTGWSDPNLFDVTLGTVPANRNGNVWAEILFGDISQSDAAASHTIQLFMQSPIGVNVFVARWNPLASVLAVGVASGFEPLFGVTDITGAGQQIVRPQWPLVIPPGFNLQGIGSTGAAAYSFELDIAYITHPIAEESFRA